MNETPPSTTSILHPAWKVLGTARALPAAPTSRERWEVMARSAELTGPARARLPGFEPQL